jgi:hypothetical protein
MPKSKIFISYSHEDEYYREELDKHLVMLQRNELIQAWTDRKILPGQEWSKEISAELESSNIILLLVSSDFLASNYCFDIEVQKAMKQHEQGISTVIPIILRACDWHDAPFGKLQGLPKDAKPIKGYSDIDDAFLEVVKGLKKILTEKSQVRENTKEITFELVNSDITNFPCDVLVLKYAQQFYGVDEFVSSLLVNKKGIDISEMQPKIGQYRILESTGHMKCKHIMFLGVPELWTFRYAEISDFAKNALIRIKKSLKLTRSVAFTIHGVGYGLDEAEAFQSQLRGIKNALDEGSIGNNIEKIFIVERDRYRFERLRRYTTELAYNFNFSARNSNEWKYTITTETSSDIEINTKSSRVEIKVEEKPFVFVAIPFKKEFDDIFYFGIQGAVHENGLLCERIDQDSFTGEILARILDKIEKAKFVIAELSGANPNVYLEVGYAWGKSKPTILLAKDTKDLQFDIRGHKCLSYERIIDLKEKLTKELGGLNGVK